MSSGLVSPTGSVVMSSTMDVSPPPAPKPRRSIPFAVDIHDLATTSSDSRVKTTMLPRKLFLPMFEDSECLQHNSDPSHLPTLRLKRRRRFQALQAARGAMRVSLQPRFESERTWERLLLGCQFPSTSNLDMPSLDTELADPLVEPSDITNCFANLAFRPTTSSKHVFLTTPPRRRTPVVPLPERS